MKKPSINKEVAVSLLIGIGAAAMNLIKAAHDKKTNEAKLVEAVNKIVEEKLGNE